MPRACGDRSALIPTPFGILTGARQTGKTTLLRRLATHDADALVSDSLAGRADIVELEPPSFAEAKAARPGLTPEEFLVRGVGISGSTPAAWSSVLEASHQLALLEPWSGNRTRPLVKRPKLYVHETDFLLHRGGTFQLADAKWTEQPRQRDADALRKVAGVLPAGSVEGMSIVCRAYNPHPLGEGVEALPLGAIASLSAWR